MAAHYDTAILPATTPPPRDKAKVEVALDHSECTAFNADQA